MTYQLIVLTGVPGSGKSTWAEQEANYLMTGGGTVSIISRDDVRFSMVPEDEDYFSKENLVFARFIRQINEAVEAGINYIFVDATHLSKASRAKLLKRLRPGANTTLVFESFVTSLYTCLKRNNLRQGRKRVPEGTIRSMYNEYTLPSEDDIPENNYGFARVVYRLNSGGEIVV